MNNINRAYKAPLSIHKSHDAVVTPIDTEDVRYAYTPINAVDEQLIDDAIAWAEAFTADEHAARVDDLIATLWPDEYEETDSWIGAIRLWLEREREAEEQQRKTDQRNAAVERSRRDRADLPDVERAITADINEIYNAVDAIDIKPLVKQHCKEWEPTGRENHFNPGASLWKDSDSGTSCYIDFGDNKVLDVGKPGGTAGPAKFMALAENLISDIDQEPKGRDYWRAIDALRREGYDIPVFVPEAGSADGGGETVEKTPYGALKRAAVATGVLPAGAFVERESDDGSTYEGFPGKETYNRTLAELEDPGIDHGRAYAGSDGDRKLARSQPSRAEIERRIEEQHGNDEQKAAIARALADARRQRDAAREIEADE